MLQIEPVSGKKPEKITPIASSIPAQKTTIHQSVFDALPDSAFVRESQLVQSPKRPEHPAPLPFSAPTLWRKVAAGTFPKPVKLSQRVTCWKVSEVRAWMTAQGMA
jgi:predicted DNA-binding transcriptional regulator AlpA